MFIQLILLPILLFQSSSISANSYGAFCTTDSNCDANQKCVNKNCRCNADERRFWTGETCAVCAREYVVTVDRCYKSFNDLKTWSAARAHCRAQYGDLFTWRNNDDEQFIRPVIQNWITTGVTSFWPQMVLAIPSHSYLAWAGATITSFTPHTTQWVDPDGMQLSAESKQWCDPTQHADYTLSKEPTKGSKKSSNGTESEECVTYNFGSSKTSFLCLADDYCSQKYPFICEMNAASMKLAMSTEHGNDVDTSSVTVGGGDIIDFEELPPPPSTSAPELNIDNTESPSALSEKTGILSQTNIIILIGVAIFLVVGAIAGYIVIQKKKVASDDLASRNGGVSQGRRSVASSIGSMVDE